MPNRLLFRTFFVSIFILISSGAFAQKHVRVALSPSVDSISVLLFEKTGVKADLKLSRAERNRGAIDMTFSKELGDWHWNREMVKWFKTTLLSLFPDEYRSVRLGNIKTGSVALDDLVTPELSNDGMPQNYKYSRNAVNPVHPYPLVRRKGAMSFDKGMTGRHIALWQSHGYYFDEKSGRWLWQRSPNFGTSEDLLTQSFVLPFLIPMLENAGAYVMTPRERDTNRDEVIADNDDFVPTGNRRHGTYNEIGTWNHAGVGFADAKETYPGFDNPFVMGTARSASVVSGENASATAEYVFDAYGRYAVYVSYASSEKNTNAAHYTVSHSGLVSEFYVNQTMGGGTWIYLGTFDFDGSGSVKVDNASAPGDNSQAGKTVSTDAVKVGGGMGKIERGGKVSGMPAFLEGALYSEQFSGIDKGVYDQWEGDYTRDFASRGAWAEHLKKDKGIPFDLSFAFHTDAGVTPGDSIVGTLSIYTLLSDGKRKYADGRDRMLGREYADLVQTQVVNDIRADFDSSWTRRELWDRSYSEARTTGVPGMILELLSHQNFADMKYAYDPAFRFTVSRAVYKGMLKFLSNTYGTPYRVQPLPVNSFSATADPSRGKIVLRWKATEDEKEPTATPDGYLVYTRANGGAFDGGRKMECRQENGVVTCELDALPGVLYSFKVQAYNDGGLSFPSQVLSAALSSDSARGDVLVVNNFDRLSGPAWFDTPSYAGFDLSADPGVDYVNQINFGGDIFEFRRDREWVSDERPGFGGSHMNRAGGVWAGNTFDYVYGHAALLADSGFSVSSCSKEAFEDSLGCGQLTPSLLDLLCGNQMTVPTGNGKERPDRYSVWTDGIMERISSLCENGTSILVSGSHVGSDVVDNVYPVTVDPERMDIVSSFLKNTLGWTLRSSHGSFTGEVIDRKGDRKMSFHSERNEEMYWTSNPDALQPSGTKAEALMFYCDTGLPAAVLFDNGHYKALTLGFPMEIVREKSILRDTLEESILR